MPGKLKCSGSGAGLGLLVTLCQCGPRSHSAFFFYMDPLPNDGDPRCYLRLSRAPAVRTRPFLGWHGFNGKPRFRLTSDDPQGVLGRCWVIIW